MRQDRSGPSSSCCRPTYRSRDAMTAPRRFDPRVLLVTALFLGAVGFLSYRLLSNRPTPIPTVVSGPLPPPDPHPPCTRRRCQPPPPPPDRLASAAGVLSAQGLADPRGCEYRQVTVIVGGCDPGPVSTAWNWKGCRSRTPTRGGHPSRCISPWPR